MTMKRSPGGPPFRPALPRPGDADLGAVVDPGGDADGDEVGDLDGALTAAGRTGFAGGLPRAAAGRAGAREFHEAALDGAPAAAAAARAGPLARSGGAALPAAGLAGGLAVDADTGLDAVDGVLEPDLHGVLEVLAALGTAGGGFGAADPAAPAEEILEEIPEGRRAVVRKIEAFEPRPPRPSARARARRDPPELAELVVLGPLFRVAQDRVGLLDLLEPGLGRLVPGVEVGMVFPGQLAVGLLDVGQGRSPGDPQDLIIIFRHYRTSDSRRARGVPIYPSEAAGPISSCRPRRRLRRR